MNLQRLLIVVAITLLLIHPVAFSNSAAHDKSNNGKSDKGGHGDDHSSDDSSSGGDSGDSPVTTVDTGSADDSSDGGSDDGSSDDDSGGEPEAPPTTVPPTTQPPTTTPPPTTVPPTTVPPTTALLTTGGGGTTVEYECDIPEPAEDVTINVPLGNYPSGGITQADDKINTDGAKSGSFDYRCDNYYVIVEKDDSGEYEEAYIDDDTRLLFSNTDDTGNMPMKKYLESGDNVKLGDTYFKICIDPAGGSMILSENMLAECSFGPGDTTPPQVTVTSPTSTTYETTTITLSVSANEPVTWTYSLDGGAETAFTPDATITAGEGTHTITITATDTSGNSASETVSFTVSIPPSIDTTPPEITCPADVTVEAESSSGTTVTLTATATDNEDPNPTIISDELFIYPLGTTTVTFAATDASGNSASCTTDVTVVDTTAPQITEILPKAITYETTEIKLAAIADEPVTWTYSLDGGESTTFTPGDTITVEEEGIHTVTITATDASGNSASETVDFIILLSPTADTTPPTVTVISPEATTYERTTIWLNVTADEPVTWTYSLDGGVEASTNSIAIITTDEGTHEITITATDAFGNSASESVTFTILLPPTGDTTPPTITCPADVTVEAEGQSGTTVTLTATAVDNEDPSPAIITDAPFIYPLGTTTVIFAATDASGNSASCTVDVTVVDTTSPTVTVNSPVEKDYEATDITLDVTSDEPVTWTYSLDGGAATTFIPGTDVTIEDEGPHTITMTATDPSGNSDSRTVDFTRIPDTTAPLVTLISPLEKTGDNDGDIIFVYSVADARQVASCSLFVNGEVQQTDTSVLRNTPQEFEMTLDFQGYNWAVECTDEVGNAGMSGLSVLAIILTDDFGGETTDLTDVDTTNVTNFTIHTPDVGKIVFTEPIDLSEGADVNTFVKVSHNRIEIVSEELPVLNKPAILTLYNITFKNPIIMRNGEKCPSSICTKISYDDGVYVFSVTQFSVYGLSGAVVGSAPSGGGGEPEPGDELSRNITITDLKISNAKIGETAVITVTIENAGCCVEDVKVWVSTLPDGWEAEEEEVELSVGLNVVELDVAIPLEEEPGAKKITVEILPENFMPSAQEDLIIEELTVDIPDVPKLTNMVTITAPPPPPPSPAVKVVSAPQATAPPSAEYSVAGATPYMPYLVILAVFVIILLLAVIALLMFLLLKSRKREEEEEPAVEPHQGGGPSGVVA